MNTLDFAGNKRVLSQLGNLFDTGRFPHALIIEGEQGLGKKTLARLLACALVCRSEDKPCMECSQCKKARSNIHPDIKEFTATGGAGSFHVDTVREIIGDAYMQPNESEYKVYILGNAHCMNAQAQNALLKVLEEPPSYVIFILTVESKSAMLSTVLSRSVCVSLEGVGANEGTDYITGHFEGADRAVVHQSMVDCGGNIGKVLDLISEGKSSELIGVCADICRALVDDNEYALLKACAAFQKDRQAVVFSMEHIKKMLRDTLVYGTGADMLTGDTEIITMFKSKLTRQKLIDLIAICDKLKEMALMNSNNALLITKICYSLREAVGR